MGSTLYATLLGEFSLAWPNRSGPGVVTQDGRYSHHLWTFLAYMCVNHAKPVSEADVLEAVWGDSKPVDPTGMLRTTLQRAREILESLGFPNGSSVLLERRGTFSWAPGVDIQLDIDELDRISVDFIVEPDAALPEILDFLPKLEAGFLPNIPRSSWVSSQRTLFEKRRKQLVRSAAERLGELKRYDEALRLAKDASEADPFDEWCQIMYMRLLHASGATQSALWHYNLLSKLYREQFGSAPPERVVACYRDIARAGRTEEYSLSKIREQLEARDNLARPLYCGFTVFQSIYHLMARSMPRTGIQAQLAILTVVERSGLAPDAERCAMAMETLRRVGLSGLREGDVCTQLGMNQYLLLLPSASLEDARMTLTRCLTSFEKTDIGQSLTVNTGVLPVQAIEA